MRWLLSVHGKILLLHREKTTTLGARFKRTDPENNGCLDSYTGLKDGNSTTMLFPTSLSLRKTLRNRVKGSFSVFPLCQLLVLNEAISYLAEASEDEIHM